MPAEFRWSILAVMVIALVVGLCTHFGISRPPINDEAVELLQGTGFKLDGFHFFTPANAYPEGRVDMIETFVPSVEALLFHGWKGVKSQENFLFAVRGCFLAAYVAACGLFTLAISNLWGARWGAVGGLMLALSSAVLIINHIVTRNGISILWSTAALLVLVAWLERREGEAKNVRTVAMVLPLVLIFGCWTYTSFRLLAAATYLALLADWARYDKTGKGLLTIALSAGGFAALLLTMVMADGTPLTNFIARGNYALGNFSGYLYRLVITLGSPWYYVERSKIFLAEDVHLFVARTPFSPWLAPFFAIGLVAAWWGRHRLVQTAATCWLAGMGLCALAGPNVKYLIVFFRWLSS